MSIITLYVGVSGSGRTYSLNHHETQAAELRHLSLDLLQLTHRSMLVAIVEQCGAEIPKRAGIPELAEIAASVLADEPTMLLLDNVDSASEKQVPTIARLLDNVAEAAMSAEPVASGRRDRIAALRRRAHLVELKPLDQDEADAIIARKAPTLDAVDRAAIQRMSAGHPATLAAYAERVAAHGSEERHTLTPPRGPRKWPQIVIIIAVLVAIHYIRRSVGGTVAADVLMSAVVMIGFTMRSMIRKAIAT